MGRVLGSDPDQLDGLGDTLTRAGDRLDAIGGEVSSLLAYADWEGGDADDFRWQWHHQLTAILHTTATQSHEAARVLHVNAQEQRTASGDRGFGYPGVPGYPAGPGGTPGASSGDHPIDLVLDVAGLLGAAVTSAELLDKAFGALGTPERLAKLAGLAGGVAKWVDNPASDVVSLFVDGGTFFHGLAEHSDDPKTVNAGVDFALTGMELALAAGGLVCPPLAVAAVVTKAVHFGFDALAAIDPALPSDIADGVSDFVADRVADTADTIGDVADVVGGVVSGGLGAVGKFFAF
jgi:hypothetical protein